MLPSLSDFAKQFDNSLSHAPTFDEVEAASGIFAEPMNSGLHLDAMHKLLSRNLEEGFEVTPDISSGPFIVLHESQKSTWAVLRHTGRSRYIYFSPTHTIAAKIAGGPLQVGRYGVDQAFDFATFDPALTLTKQSLSNVQSNHVVLKNGERKLRISNRSAQCLHLPSA